MIEENRIKAKAEKALELIKSIYKNIDTGHITLVDVESTLSTNNTVIKVCQWVLQSKLNRSTGEWEPYPD